MKEYINTAAALQWLQEELDIYNEDAAHYGHEDRIVKHRLCRMLGMKDMLEALIGEPVNLQKDGLVTVGF